MKRTDLKDRILLAIGAGSVVFAACGSEESVPSNGADASGDSTVADAAGDVEDATQADVATDNADGSRGQDAVADSPTSDVRDASGDACVPIGDPCTQATDCCAPSTCRGSVCVLSVRRPFLVGSSLRVAEAAERADWLPAQDAVIPHGLDRATAEALAADWLNDGCEEHASIAAFARFTLQLVSVGAPPEMILESQRAAMDEVRHARACFALARRYGNRTMGPAALSLDGALTPMTLAEIAALTAEEGCVGETLGVLLAEEQLARTTDPTVRALLVDASIVADEGSHAALAWGFVAWAIARGGEPVRRAVAATLRRAIDATLAMPIRRLEGVDLDAWRAHGRLTCEDAHAVAARGVREIVEPCAARLLGAPLAPSTALTTRA